jgi:dihydroxy-acid dehydratase
VMLAVKDLLHLDCLTVTGKTLGENLQEIEASTFFFETGGYLANVKVAVPEIIRPRDDPFGPEGGVAVLRGNLAPGGAVIKHFSVPKEMHVHTGPARVFDTEDLAVEALLNRDVKPGDVVVIRYEGPRANGMPEMYYATAIIAASKELTATCAVVTDGRYSGAAKGPAVGHVSPEAVDGGPIALVEEGDLIEINVPERRLAVVGTREGRLTPEQVDILLAERRARWTAPPARHTSGILSLYAKVAAAPAEGAYLA